MGTNQGIQLPEEILPPVDKKTLNKRAGRCKTCGAWVALPCYSCKLESIKSNRMLIKMMAHEKD